MCVLGRVDDAAAGETKTPPAGPAAVGHNFNSRTHAPTGPAKIIARPEVKSVRECGGTHCVGKMSTVGLGVKWVERVRG